MRVYSAWDGEKAAVFGITNWRRKRRIQYKIKFSLS